jgi:hypothetical protein
MVSVDRDRLSRARHRGCVNVPSFTGDEENAARLMVELFEGLDLQVQWQQVEEGRANALGTWAGAGGGKSLDVQRPSRHLVLGPRAVARNVPGFQPQAFERTAGSTGSASPT